MSVEIPGYELRAPLGEGTSAVVFEAIERRTGRVVALKVLRDELLKEPTARARFHREARALMCVVHPSVVTVYDYSGPTAERVFIALERLEGRTLRELIEERGNLGDAAAAAILLQVLQALAAAHAQGLLHRDLSVANIVVDGDGRAVVTDFGLAAAPVGKSLRETFETNAQSLVGTPLYYSPELMLGGTYSAASDLYAAGICFTYALLGRPPTETDDVAKMLTAVLDGTLDRLATAAPEVDGTLASLGDALTAPTPEGRPKDAAAAAKVLAEWLTARKLEPLRAVRSWLDPDTVVTTAPVQMTTLADVISAMAEASNGRFVIERQIGQGGMARVFFARDTMLQRDVAVKLMFDAGDPIVRTRFHREARALARVRHPNVIEVIDYSGPKSALPYIVLAYVDGVTLEALAGEKPLQENAALCVALCISEGLQAVHDEGFFHRDVKPENVFLDHSGNVVLADFGIVRSATGERTGTFAGGPTMSIGSPLFAAPEQLFEPESAGPRSDLFSLGSTLFFLLTSRAPIAQSAVMAALRDLMDGKIERLDERHSPEVRALLARLHAQDPKDRPASAAEVSAELRRILAVRNVGEPRWWLRKVAVSSTRAVSSLELAKTQKDVASPRAAVTVPITVPMTSPMASPSKPAVREGPSRLLSVAVVIAGLAVGLGGLLLVERLAAPEPPPAVTAPPPEPSPMPIPVPPTPAAVPRVPDVEERATLQLSSKPWAKVTIAGQSYGTTPTLRSVDLPPGRYVVRFENPSFAAVEKTVELRAGERREVHVVLKKP